MAKLSLTSNLCEFTMPEGMFDRLSAHLFRNDDDEHAAIIYAGLSETPDGRIRLLARELHLARDGVDFVSGKRGYKMLRAEFVRDHALACQEDNLVYLNIHNHFGKDSVRFSPDDLDSHERGYPALVDIADGLPMGALVTVENAMAGDIWLPDGRRLPLTRTVIVGRRRRVLFPQPIRRHFAISSAFNRQTRMFGDVGQQILSETKVAIVGLGGVGSLLAEYLARLGVGHFVLIDGDRIEPSNLPRITGAARWDALTWLCDKRLPAWVQEIARRFSTLKVKIARRIIRRANKTATIDILPMNLLEPRAASALLDCDYIFLAADEMRARLLFNAVVNQYIIPGVQMGAKVTPDPATGEISMAHSAARIVTSERGCLMCNGLINPSKLQEESQTEQERREQRYVDDPDVIAASVITLNALNASVAANDFMFYITGLTHDDANTDYVRFFPLTREIELEEPRKSENCSECGCEQGTRLGRGDLGPRLPTFFRG